MKQLSTGLILLAVIVSSCQKSSNDAAKPKTPSSPVVVTPPPVADFKISNAAGAGSVWEALTLNFDNSSTDADSYFWDFGNGTTSTEKNPSNVSLVPCGMSYTITLTIKNKSGQSATYSVPYGVLCSRGMGFGAHGEPKH
jgi:PKD repeat protein